MYLPIKNELLMPRLSTIEQYRQRADATENMTTPNSQAVMNNNIYGPQSRIRLTGTVEAVDVVMLVRRIDALYGDHT